MIVIEECFEQLSISVGDVGVATDDLLATVEIAIHLQKHSTVRSLQELNVESDPEQRFSLKAVALLGSVSIDNSDVNILYPNLNYSTSFNNLISFFLGMPKTTQLPLRV